MIALGIAAGPVEHRSSDGGYTDQITSAMMYRATHRVSSAGTAAVETAAGLVSRAFALADVAPASARVALSPATMAVAGRQMLTRGETLLALRLASTGVVALPCGFWDVRGLDPLPETWRYRVSCFAPDGGGGTTSTIPRSGVLHAISDGDPVRPWQGRGALQRAAVTAALTADLEDALAGEALIPPGAIVPVPGGTKPETVDLIRADIESRTKHVLFPETTKSGYGAGAVNAPARDWRIERIGPAPDAGEVEATAAASARMLAALGIPPAWANPRATAMALREALRSAWRSLILPLAAVFQAAASEALEIPVALGWDRLQAADVRGAASAYKTLRDAGIPDDDARRIAGL